MQALSNSRRWIRPYAINGYLGTEHTQAGNASKFATHLELVIVAPAGHVGCSSIQAAVELVEDAVILVQVAQLSADTTTSAWYDTTWLLQKKKY